MIASGVVFSSGGAVLWGRGDAEQGAGDLIREVLLQKGAVAMDSQHVLGANTWRCTVDNELNIFFAVACSFQLLYLEDLAKSFKSAFLKSYRNDIENNGVGGKTYNFDAAFDALLENEANKADSKRKKMRSFEESRKDKGKKDSGAASTAPAAKAESGSRIAKAKDDDTDLAQESDDVELDPVARARAALAARGGRNRRGKGGAAMSSPSSKGSSPIAAGSPSKKGKKPWWRPGQNGDGPEVLDYSDGSSLADSPMSAGNAGLGADGGDFATHGTGFDSSDDEDSADDANQGRLGSIFNYFSRISGNKPITAKDLEGVLDQFRDMLVSKNVAASISDSLVESVQNSLIGKKISGINGVKTAVREAMEAALTRILTPKQSQNILKEVETSKAEGRPYVITFVGVNGVGKSTSLSKVCRYLMHHGHRVLITACDTFRSGAVEQLRVHATRLGADLYEQGYAKDPASVAMAGVRHAKDKGYDVVLIDTAGRMQDNEPLMRALAKLVNLNRPDKVLFVGEALVGNDSVDQLQKFNQAMIDFAGVAEPRTIDGVMLTKFDTIDDKVGAAVSMVYTTGQPVVFVGVGQTYTDIRHLNVKSLVRALLR